MSKRKKKRAGQPGKKRARKSQAKAPRARRRAAQPARRTARCPFCGARGEPPPLLPPPVTSNAPEPLSEMLRALIAERLAASGLSDYKIAQATTLQRQTIGSMRRGEHTPTMTSLSCLGRHWAEHVSALVVAAEQRWRAGGR